MYKKIGRSIAIIAIIALTIFAGQSYARLHKISLFKEIPVEEDSISQDIPSVVQTSTSSADTIIESVYSTNTSSTTQHYSIKSKEGDDEDEEDDD